MKRQPGFTIVELLIVIVVIAILAAISIVAYTGIQQKARVSAVSSALGQASHKLASYSVENADQYPSDLSSVGINDSSGITYQYSVNNTATPATYCVTATTGSTSYKASSAAPTPSSGGCAGHGQGGVAAITNLASNPSFEANITGINTFTATNSRPSGGAASGTYFLRSTRGNTSGSSGSWWDAAVPVTVGQTYMVSLAVRGNVTTTRDLRIEWINAAGTSQVGNNTIASVTPSTTWTTIGGSATAPAGAGRLRLTLYTQGASTGTTSDYVDIDSVMITEGGTSYAYADGNSSNWVWNGTINNSTSTGPAS